MLTVGRLGQLTHLGCGPSMYPVVHLLDASRTLAPAPAPLRAVPLPTPIARRRANPDAARLALPLLGLAILALLVEAPRRDLDV